jgi:predicted PurR-regulated permease PerM
MESNTDRTPYRSVLETGLHLAVVGLLLVYCFQVVRPFIQLFAWGGILAIALHPLFVRLQNLLGGKAGVAAACLVGLLLLILTAPSILITASLVESASELTEQLRSGTSPIPPPPASLVEWPLIGEKLHSLWSTASQDLEVALQQAGPLVKAAVGTLLSVGASAGMAIAVFALSIVIAGVMLSYGEAVAGAFYKIASRLFGDRGDELVDLSRDAVASVTCGILAVAVIQATLSGIALVLAGVPGAGLWALLVLLMAVVQIPPVLLLGPIVAYVFATESTGVAVIFAIWTVPVAFSDNVLKPLLLGRGAKVPMLVIFVGAIGGFILEGIIGLFVGAVALSVLYTLLKAWLDDVV